MKKILILCATAAVLTACNNSKKKDSTANADVITPATPGGTFSVTFSDRDKDTATVHFTFTVDSLKYERSFNDVPLMKGLDDTALYRILWDAPNSVWIGFLKADRDTRYYHGSQDGRSLKILWVPSPPAKYYEYMEKKMGLGDAIRNQPRVLKYKENFQSGNIIADFIVEIQPGNATDEVNVYIEFGGVTRVLTMPVPEGAKPYVQAYKQDHCFAGLEIDGELEEYFEIKVVGGRIGARQLKAFAQ